MLKSILSSKKYWITVSYIGIGFMIIYSIVEHMMTYGGLAIDSFAEERIHNGRWVRYVLSRLVGGLLYGMIMGYYLELRKRKSNR